MLTLRQQQQSLRRILTGAPAAAVSATAETDPWLTEVLHSPGLAMTREIAAWWLRFQIESQCIYTSRLMKRMGCYATYIDDHFSQNPTPPAIEELALQFLTSLAGHPDTLLRAVAAFEQACLAPAGPPHPVITQWDRNPNAVITALNQGAELPPPEPGIQYTLTIGPGTPPTVHCSEETPVYSHPSPSEASHSITPSS
jgi:hypothetical protein